MVPAHKVAGILKKKRDTNFRISVILTLCFLLVCGIVYYAKNSGYSKDVILQKANSYFAHEQYFMAAKYFNKAVGLGAEGPEVFRNYGVALFKLGNYDLAIKNLKLSVEIDPYNSDTYYLLGNAYYQKAYSANSSDMFLQSVECLEKAINFSPDMEKAYILIGLSYRNCGMQDTARAWYRRALLASNFSPPGFYNLIGHTFREEERYKEAADYYQRAIDIDYTFTAAYCNLGDMYLKMNDKAAAMLKYKRAIGVEPNYVLPYIKIGQVYYDDLCFDDAVFWALQAFNINSDSDKANYLLGMSYKELGRKNEAVEYLQKAAYRGSDEAVYELKNIGIDLLR